MVTDPVRRQEPTSLHWTGFGSPGQGPHTVPSSHGRGRRGRIRQSYSIGMDAAEFRKLRPADHDPRGVPPGGAIAVADPVPVAVIAEPIPPAATPLARPLPVREPTLWQRLVPADTDSYALASAVCGFTAIIPVISQVAGVVLGVAGLVRIRRARRAGRPRCGVGWACAGLVSSGIALAGWIVILVAFVWVRSTISGVTGQLSALSPRG